MGVKSCGVFFKSTANAWHTHIMTWLEQNKKSGRRKAELWLGLLICAQRLKIVLCNTPQAFWLTPFHRIKILFNPSLPPCTLTEFLLPHRSTTAAGRSKVGEKITELESWGSLTHLLWDFKGYTTPADKKIILAICFSTRLRISTKNRITKRNGLKKWQGGPLQ